MRWFHTHNYELVAKTYAPSRIGAGEIYVAICRNSISQGAALLQPEGERAIYGFTTFVWKCSDPQCSDIKQTIAPGKEVEK